MKKNKSKLTSQILSKYVKKYEAGGKLPGDDKPKSKTYTNKAEYDKALQAYNDSLALYNFQGNNLEALLNSKTEEEFSKKVGAKEKNNLNWNSRAGFFIKEEDLLPKELKQSYSNLSQLNSEKPEVIKTKKDFDSGFFSAYGQVNHFQKPVVKPEFKETAKQQNNSDGTIAWTLKNGYKPVTKEIEEQLGQTFSEGAYYNPTASGTGKMAVSYFSPILAKGTLEQEVKPTMAKGTMESEPKPINELMMPSGSYMQKDEFIKRYGEKPWLKATGQKFTYGGKMKYDVGGNFTPYGNPNNPYAQEDYSNFPTIQPNYVSGVSNNYTQATPISSTPNVQTSTLPKSTSKSNSGVSDISGYAGYANQALSAIPTTQNDDYMMNNDATISSIKEGVKQVPVVGQFVALGDTGSDMLYQQASKTSGLESAAWAGAAGTVSPSSGWEKKNEMYKSGEIDSTEFGVATLAHFLMPGLDTMYLQDKHNKNVDAKKRTSDLFASNKPMYERNIGSYDKQMNYLSGKSFKYGGNKSNVWTLMDDSNPLAYGGNMTTIYENGGTHEENPNGGIPIGDNSLVEEGEVRFDYKDKNKNLKSYIFSNKLKYRKNGK